MGALVHPARKRISNENIIKKRIKLPIRRVVQKPVAHGGFMDGPWLGIIDFELLISPMFVGAAGQIVVQ